SARSSPCGAGCATASPRPSKIVTLPLPTRSARRRARPRQARAGTGDDVRMKNARACIKCDHDTIWQVDPIAFPEPKTANVITTLPVATRMVDNPDPGLLGRPTVRRSVGRFVAYVCAACGYTELYATDIDDLATLQQG